MRCVCTNTILPSVLDYDHAHRIRLTKHTNDSLLFTMSKLEPGADIPVIYTECYSVRLLTMAITILTVQF